MSATAVPSAVCILASNWATVKAKGGNSAQEQCVGASWLGSSRHEGHRLVITATYK